MRVVKIALGALAGLLVLAIIGAALLAWFFDPNDYKSYVTGFFEERTGRTLEIEDDLELSFFPWLAVETGGITVGNAPGFTERPFATIDRGSARVRLWPLLVSREFDVGTISLNGVELNLATNADGIGNWEDLLGGGPAAPGGQPAAGSSSPIESLDIEGVSVRGSRVFWRENVDDTRFVVSELNLSTGAIGADEPFDVELAFGLLDVARQLTAEIDTQAEVTLGAGGAATVTGLELDFGLSDGSSGERARGALRVDSLAVTPERSVTLGAGALTGTLVDPPIGAGALPVEARWNGAELDASAFDGRIDGLSTALGGITATWRLDLASLADAPRLSGLVTVQSGSVAALLDVLGAAAPEGMARNELGNFSASTAFDASVADETLDLSDAEVNVFGTTVRIREASLNPRRGAAAVDVPPFAPNEQLRAFLAANLPEDVAVGAFERLAFSGGVEADLESGNTSLRDFTAELLGARISGNLDVTSDAGGSVYSGAVSTSPFAPHGFLAAFGAYFTETVNADELGTLAVATDFVYDTGADAATLNPLRLEALGLSARGELALEGLSDSPRLTGNATVADFDPRRLIRRFGQEPPQTSDPTALRRVNIDTRFEMTSALGRFESLVVMLDDTRIAGDFVVDDFEDPSYRFSLEIDALDADRYLPPQSDAAEETERRAGDLAIEREPLEVLELDGRVSVGNLRLAGMSYQNVSTNIAVGSGRLALDAARANLYGGEFDGSFSVDASGAVPGMRLRGQAIGLALEPLITAIAGDASFSGTANFDINLTGEGATVTDNLRSAAGTMGFALRDGAIGGLNVAHKLCGYYNAVAELPPPDQNRPRATPYELIQGTATVSDGIASSSDLRVRSTNFEVRGGGTLSLADQIGNYDFEARITRSIEIRGCEAMDRFIGIDFPLDLDGPITSADSLRPDYSEILRRVIEDRIREGIRDRIRDALD